GRDPHRLRRAFGGTAPGRGRLCPGNGCRAGQGVGHAGPPPRALRLKARDSAPIRPHPPLDSPCTRTSMYSHLLSPVQAGSLLLPNRVLMAPLTRSRAGQPGDVPTPMNAEYYAQRAGAGLIVSEATQISRQGQGYAWTPGMHTDAQEAGWAPVTGAVHAKGGRIAAQLWHVGRISHPLLQP